MKILLKFSSRKGRKHCRDSFSRDCGLCKPANQQRRNRKRKRGVGEEEQPDSGDDIAQIIRESNEADQRQRQKQNEMDERLKVQQLLATYGTIEDKEKMLRIWRQKAVEEY
jgi:hypothetical protein